jgi:hypothetical protein
MFDEKHDFMLNQFEKVDALRGGRTSFDDVKHIAGIKSLKLFAKGAATQPKDKNSKKKEVKKSSEPEMDDIEATLKKICARVNLDTKNKVEGHLIESFISKPKSGKELLTASSKMKEKWNSVKQL